MPARRMSAAPRAVDAVNPLEMDAAARRRVSGPGFRTFKAIADEWRLSEEARLRILGRPGRSTYHLWASKARAEKALTLPFDVLSRISAVLGIYKALKIIFARDAEALEWLQSPNAGLLFGGQRPFDLMTSGSQDHLMLVRRHLDAWRGGHFAAPAAGVDSATPLLTDEDIVFI